LAAIAIAIALVASDARADDRYSLDWQAPAECPSKARVDEAVRAWLDKPRPDQAAGGVRVDAQVHAVEGGWELALTLVAPGGAERQSLIAARCETLVELVALKVALAADPAALLRSLEASRAGRAPSPAPRFALHGALGAGLGPLPDVSAFAVVGGAMKLPGWRVELDGTAWLPRPASYPELPSVGANLSLVTGIARGCLAPAMGAIDFPICGGVELGVLRGSGFGVAQVETSSQLWAAAVVGPAVHWPLGSAVSFALGADAVIGMVRPAFHMRNLEQLYRPDTVAARISAGLEVQL
jgi:hypothetical protein